MESPQSITPEAASSGQPKPGSPERVSSIFAARFWTLAGLIALAALGSRTLSGSAIFRHLAQGRHLLEHGITRYDPFSFGLPPDTPWYNPSPLYDLAVHLLASLGVPLLILAHIAAVATGLLLAIRSARITPPTWATGAALLLAAWAIAPTFTPRPELAAVLFFGGFLHLLRPRLTSAPPARILALAATAALWSLVHPSYLLAPILAALRLLDEKFTSPFPVPILRGSLLVLLICILTLLPLLIGWGPRAILHTFHLLLGENRNLVVEWISPFYEEFRPHPFRFASSLLLMALAIPVITWTRRLELVHTVPAVLATFIIATAAPYPALAAALAMPLVILGLQRIDDALRALSSKLPLLPLLAPAATGFGVLLTIGLTVTNLYYLQTGLASSFGFSIHPHIHPAPTILQHLDRLGPQRVLIHTAPDGDYLLWARPGLPRFIDSRAHLHRRERYDKLHNALLGDAPAAEWLEAYSPDAILLNATWINAGLAIDRLQASGRWTLAAFDGISALLLRSTASDLPLIREIQATYDGRAAIEQAYHHHTRHHPFPPIRSPLPASLIGAGAVFHHLGHYQSSYDLHRLLIRDAPRMKDAWFRLGVAALHLGRPRLAETCLERYTQWSGHTAVGWLWLALAREHNGNLPEAQRAYARASTLDPMMTRHFRTLPDLPRPPEKSLKNYAE
ncbi:MAG TPA: tetratricopeptide repeat protein [Kiritimatiellia bacterium]|nr:tetratricopeptide repeat protein [Kiritimatiellia bacterium]